MGWMEGTKKVGKKIQSGNVGGAASDYATGKVWREDWKSNTGKLTNQSGGGTDDFEEQKLTPPTVAAPQVGPAFSGGRLSTDSIKMAGPSAASVNTRRGDEWRGRQSTLAGQLADRASGKGEFISDLALKQAQDTNQAAAFAQLASARGGASPLLARQTMATSSDLAAKTGRDAAMAKLQESQAAQSQLAGLAHQARGQDLETAAANARFAQEAGIVGYQGGIDQMRAQAGMDQQAGLAYQELQGKYAALGLDADRYNQLAAIEAQKFYRPGGSIQRPVGPSMMSGVLTGVGTGVGAYFGGPAGAAAGAKIGSTAGGMADKQYGSRRGEAARYNQEQGIVDNSNQDLGAGLGGAAGAYAGSRRDARLEREKKQADIPGEDDYGDRWKPKPRKSDEEYKEEPGSGQGGRRGQR